MKRYFEEEQSFRENRWLWLLITFVSLMAIIPLLYAFYWQLVMHEPWGDEPMSDGGLITFFIFILFSWGFVLWILLSSKFDLYIDALGIHYRFYPVKPKWKLVQKQDIQAFEVRKKRNRLEARGFGYHRNLFRKTVSIIIRGPLHIRLTLANNHKLILGTQRPEEFERAIRRMLETDLTL